MPSLTKSSGEKLKHSRRLVETIVRRYPDYGKATGEYVNGLVEAMATFPEPVQNELADIRAGISARLRFLPTVADLVELGAGIEQRMANEARPVPPRPRLVRDTRPYNPQQVPVYFDRNGDRISEREAEERAEQARREREGMKRALLMLAYVKHIGNGNALDGWQVLQERGETEPPEGWTPETSA